jgi:hypothetical protein
MSKLVIDIKNNPKTLFVLKQKLDSHEKQMRTVKDGSILPEFIISNGYYNLYFKNSKLNIYIKDNIVVITVFGSKLDLLKEFINELYLEYCSPDEMTIYYVSEGNKWSIPVFRRPRDKVKMLEHCSRDMNSVLSDIDNFFTNDAEELYCNTGKPYRRGYLLTGDPGTGKSTLIEIISALYNMPVYLVNLNAESTTDAILISLICQIPPRSLIVIEEIEKQLQTVNANTNNKVSYGGILSALDGPQRVSHGSIILITANSIDSLENEFKIPLLRPGRIDKHFIFKTRVVQNE